jgi:regulator of sigma D
MSDSIDRQPANDRRSRTRKEIKQLIAERNEVLSLYCQLAGCESAQRKAADEIESETLQEFCQVLIDYIATGHFELYRRISEGGERRTDMVKLANTIYPRIQKTTQIAVDFNDLYDGGNSYNADLKAQLPDHLSKLGEELATRIELEDKLINTLLSTAPVTAETAMQ